MNLRIMEAPSTEFFARMLSTASASEIPMTSFKTAILEIEHETTTSPRHPTIIKQIIFLLIC